MIKENKVKKEFSTEKEREILEYYKTHSDNNTAKFFHIHFCRIEEILKKQNVAKHTKEENTCLWKQNQKNNNLKKYGVAHHLQAKCVKEKRKQTILKKYGVGNVFAINEIKNKIKTTNINRYGVENYSSTQECKDKVSATNKIKHGNANIGKFGSEEHNRAMIEKYGVSYFSQTKEWASKSRKRYIADNIYFDSLPELAFYLWHKESGIKIERVSKKFEYEFEGQIHYYFPDFEVNGKLYEIKGNQFLAKDGKWKSPYEDDCGKYEAKRQCALVNNVIILYKNEYKYYVDWFRNKKYRAKDFAK